MSDKLNEPRTIVQLVLIDETGDSYYRMRWPGKQIADQAPAWRVINLDARAEERVEWALEADLLVVYQSNDIDLLPLLEERRRRGRLTLAEYNDNFYAPPPASPVAGPWSSPLMWQTYERFMLESDGVVVTGPGLYELFRTKTEKEITILENHLPITPAAFEELWPKELNKIGFGWAGSLGHIADVLAIIPTLRELIAAHPELMLHIMGNEAIPGMLNIPPDRFQFTNWGTMAQYYEFWKPVQIGFAPLIDTPYNRCRSDIKAVEMASRGVLPLLSDALPYQHFLERTSAPVFRSVEDLEKKILEYAKQPEKLRDDALRCYEYVRDERVGINRTERLELYLKMLSGEPSTHKWPMGPGYYEIQGTPNSTLKQASVLAQLQSASEQKKHQEAVQIAQQWLAGNPFSADVALSELNNRRILKDSELHTSLESYAKRFPLDLRFNLLKVISSRSEEERLENWNAVVDILDAQSDAFRTFFQTDVLKLFSRHLVRVAGLLTVGKRLLKLYPNSASLRFYLGLAFEREGHEKEAAEQFDWVMETREKCLPNEEFFKSTDYSYLKTWQEALEARQQGLQKGNPQKDKKAASSKRSPKGKKRKKK